MLLMNNRAVLDTKTTDENGCHILSHNQVNHFEKGNEQHINYWIMKL